MAVDTIPYQRLELAKGQDWTLQVRVMAPEKVVLDASAATGATSLTVRPLEDALASGDKLLFGKNMVVTLSAAAAANATTLAVTATAAPLQATDVGQKIRDLTGFTIEFEALAQRGDATPLITKTGIAVITLLTQTGDDRGKVEVAGVAADTSGLEPGTLYFAVWRRNAGSARPLAEGDLVLREAGFLA